MSILSRCLLLKAVVGLIAAGAAAAGAAPGNLLRNGKFQDDWYTCLPELKNHNWNYSMESYHRRDYCPDGWQLSGSWDWQNPDAPWGGRALLLKGPKAGATQNVTWNMVHDSKKWANSFPDAGGFPVEAPLSSLRPERLMRDMTLRVRVKGSDVPTGAGEAQIRFSSPEKPYVAAAVALPEGTYDWRWIGVTLSATQWLAAAKAAPDGRVTLPDRCRVSLSYTGSAGTVEIGEAVLAAGMPDSPNLLANGGFEAADDTGYPQGWSAQEKYRYFPPRIYYIFNTWHNSWFPNRGPVAADSLIARDGARSLKMIVAAGDEKCVTSAPIALNQAEARAIEVWAWIKTDKLTFFQIDALNEKGERLDVNNFIHKYPPAIGSDEWRLIRQMVRPTEPVQSLRIRLAARGVNGFTLGGTGLQPQNNVVGTIWWDDVRVFESESSAADLAARGVKAVAPKSAEPDHPVLAELNTDWQLLGANTLTAVVTNRGSAETCYLHWSFTSPAGQSSEWKSATQKIAKNAAAAVQVPYEIDAPCSNAYTEYRGVLSLRDGKDRVLASSELWFSTWTTPIDIELGSTYLAPDKTAQYVRMNFGFTPKTMERAAGVKLDVIRKGTGKVVRSKTIPATPAVIREQRDKLPLDVREDLTALVLTDLDVSFLPVQPFEQPERNWFIRATLLDAAGKPMGSADSAAFCRLAHEAVQPAIASVTIDTNNNLYVNGQLWLAWGVTYGHNPVYEGPADPGPGKYRDMHNLPGWNLYDRHGGHAGSRRENDLTCLRFVAGSITPPKFLEKGWTNDNLYGSSAFVVPGPAYSVDELVKKAGGQEKLDAYLAFVKSSPMVVSTAPGIEETFAYFTSIGDDALRGLSQVTDYLRANTGRPVMTGHGGYWNRLEFEKAPFFDIYDPETEPLYPAPVHTDLKPLIEGKAKVAWLRPQMYETVPYERWRFHVWVEMMRGVRGWQMAHGPADTSTFRGLHAEVASIAPAIASADPGPAITLEPWIEHWSRRVNGKTILAAATTHGLAFGGWQWDDSAASSNGRARVTSGVGQWSTEENGYGLTGLMVQKPSVHGMQWLPDARAWPAGSKLVQWIKLDRPATPSNVVLLVKVDGRWTHSANWGPFDASEYQRDLAKAEWFMRLLYRHSSGFLGWSSANVTNCLPFSLSESVRMGDLPGSGEWVRLEVPLERIKASDGLLDGVAFYHDGGRVWWGRTSIAAPDGTEALVFGDSVGLPADKLAKVKISAAGLKKGARVRVLFEDREIVAGDGFFTDDFRGRDLYQRFGGGSFSGYGDDPVALHVYEIPTP